MDSKEAETGRQAFELAAERWSQLPPLIRATVGDALANLATRGMDRGRRPSTPRRAKVYALVDMAWMVFYRLGIALTQEADDEAEKAGISLDVSFGGVLGKDVENDIARSASAGLAQEVDQERVAEILTGTNGLPAFEAALREMIHVLEEEIAKRTK